MQFLADIFCFLIVLQGNFDMNIDTNDQENEENTFCLEDVIVLYFDIEINHVNDNKALTTVTLKKAAVWLLLICLLAGIFHI